MRIKLSEKYQKEREEMEKVRLSVDFTEGNASSHRILE